MSDIEDVGDEVFEVGVFVELEDDGFGGMKWECLVVILSEVCDFILFLEKIKDFNEKIFCN